MHSYKSGFFRGIIFTVKVCYVVKNTKEIIKTLIQCQDFINSINSTDVTDFNKSIDSFLISKIPKKEPTQNEVLYRGILKEKKKVIIVKKISR